MGSSFLPLFLLLLASLASSLRPFSFSSVPTFTEDHSSPFPEDPSSTFSSSPPPTHKCIHDQVFDARNLITVPQNYPRGRDTTKEPIRLIVDTSFLENDSFGRTCKSTGQSVQTTTGPYTCKEADVLSPAVLGYIKGLVEEAKELWIQTLLVVRVNGLLQLSGGNMGIYGGVFVNSTYTNGVVGDMVMYVTARPIVSTGSGTSSTLAVATSLQKDSSGKPICGQLNINIAGMSTRTSMYPQNFGVVIHEMTHAFGFSFALISDLAQELQLNVAAGDASSKRYVITSPKVQAWAREYYKCPQMQGVELENQGGTGTAYSHWEKRVANNEYMTGTASRNPVFSDLTLALLEDTGWYGVNNSLTGQLLWGQGMGCDFALRSCPNWPDYQGYFCDSSTERGCTADYQAKGVCQIGTATGVDPAYKYFPDKPTTIGTVDLPDYCPVTWAYENGWCYDSSQSSTSLGDQGEQFGDNSRCFDSSLLKDLPVGGQSNQVCYVSACSAPDELRVKVGRYWYLCPPGGRISVIGFGGQLNCPQRIQQICANAGTDATWPVFSTISPNAGGPGLKVTIAGRNFAQGIKVNIDDELDDVVVVSATVITATIPKSDHFKNPANIIERKSSLVLTDTKGRSAVGYNAFTVKVKFDWEFIKNSLEYVGDNWLISAAVIVALVVTCLICGYCCYRQKGKAEEADTEEYYDE